METHKNDKSPSLRILLVEDDEHDRTAFRRAFDKSPIACEIQACVRAEEALQKLSDPASSFDILVTDFLLPGMNGLELCKKLLADQVSIPLLILTGSGSEHIAVEAIKAGVDDYIVKDPGQGYQKLLPFVIQDVVRKHMDRQKRKQAERDFAEISMRQQSLLEAIPDIVMEVDARKKYKWANHAGYDFFGEDVIGREAGHYFEGEQDTYETVNHLFSGDEKVIYVESWQRRKDSRKRLLAWWCRVLKDEQGNVTGAISTARDITERKQVEEQLRQARKMESIETMIGGIAHDFNNILYTITGNAELALDDTPELNPVHANLMEIKSAGLRGADIVRQLLNFARYTSDQEFKPIGAVTLLRDILNFMRPTMPVDIDIRNHLPDTEIMIYGDPSQFRKAIVNVCINASEAMEATGGLLEIAAERIDLDKTSAEIAELSPGQYLAVTIRDNGPGIAPDIFDRIFDPYFTTKEAGKGSGMGLSMAQGMAKNHDGTILIHSQPGEGATFTLLVPVLSEKAIEDIPAGFGETILVVDDEKPVAKMNGATLERLGYSVTVETSPTKALSLFKSQPAAFDLVISDMAMPNMTGDNLARSLLGIRPDMPIILCTGFSERLNQKKAASIGIKGFLMKPVVKADMAKMVRKVLNEARSKR